jgi:tetratricopeptide (TPR) repeat protein
VDQMEKSFEVLSRDEPDADLAWLAAQLGRFLYFVGDTDRAAERLDRALELAESLGLPEVLSQALNSKGALVMMGKRGRPEEGFALVRHSLNVALDHDEWEAALRAYYNLANLLYYYERFEEANGFAADGLVLARRLGARVWEWNMVSELVYIAYATGDWDEAIRLAREFPQLDEEPATRAAAVELVMSIPPLLLSRGQPDEAAEVIESYVSMEASSDLQEVIAYQAAHAALLRHQGRLEEALEAGRKAVEGHTPLGATFPAVKTGFVEAAESALALGKTEDVEELLAIPAGFGAGEFSPFWRGQSARLGARLAATRGEEEMVGSGFEAAALEFRTAGIPFWLAVSLLEHAEWLTEQSREDEARPLAAEAREIFERLKATPWLERANAVGGVKAAAAASESGVREAP